jgi:hypothetical protein
MLRIASIIIAIACQTAAQAEVVLEFDDKAWRGMGEEATLKQRVRNDGLCLVADDASKVGEILKGWEFDRFQRRTTRFALRGVEGKGALVAHGEAIEEENITTIVVTCEPDGVSVGHLNRNSPTVIGLHMMDADLQGAAGFLDTVQEGSRLARELKEFPLVVLRVRSTCSYGLLVRVLQLVTTGGCRHVIITVDDDFPGLNAGLKTDIEMTLPGVNPADVAAHGRITVNFMDDGSLTGEDHEVLATDDEIMRYIEQRRDGFVKLGKQPVLFFRGDKDAVMKGSRRVVRLGANAGVTAVIFGVFAKP